MGKILNMKCKNCNCEDTYFVGYGNISAIDLSGLLDELNYKEESSIRTKLKSNELDQNSFYAYNFNTVLNSFEDRLSNSI